MNDFAGSDVGPGRTVFLVLAVVTLHLNERRTEAMQCQPGNQRMS
jgi:hypothetical protein